MIDLEATRTLLDAAQVEIARLAKELETANRKLENAIVLCEGDWRRHAAEHAAQVRQAEDLRAELEKAKADLDAARAVAIEEAARVAEAGDPLEIHDEPGGSELRIAKAIRALAPLAPALCVVERETIEKVRRALELAHADVADYKASEGAEVDGHFEVERETRAALKALEGK